MPSPALLRALPELMAERRLSEVVFHRRWLVDSVERWIDSPPWRTDYQGRLRRNVPGLWRFDGLVHTDGDVLGERRLVELPLYHCDLLLTSFERRWGKSLRYEAEAPGAVWDGFPLNATYLPERFADLSTRAVPVEDRPSLQALVDSSERTAPSRTAGDGAAPVRELEFGEVDRFNSSARPTQVALRAALEWVHAPDSLPAGTVVHHDVRIRNLGDALWRPERGPSSIQVSLRCRDPANGKLVVEHLEPFTETVWPGQETVLLLPVRTPRDPGRYVLELALAFEHRRFGDGPRREVTVLPGTPASVNGNLDALAEAAGTARALSDIERRRDESQLAAARLRATRRYRVAHLLVRLARRRPRGSPLMAAEPRLPRPARRIYATGEVEGEDGTWLAALPTGIAREEALALSRLVRDEGLERTLEVGLAYGLSAVAIASVHAERRRGAHTAIDPHAHGHYRSIGPLNLRRAGLEEWVDVIEEGSEAALPRLAAQGAGTSTSSSSTAATISTPRWSTSSTPTGSWPTAGTSRWTTSTSPRSSARSRSSCRIVPTSRSRSSRAAWPSSRKLHADDREWDHHVRFESFDLTAWTGSERPRRRHPMPLPPSAASPAPAPAATLAFCITTRGPAERVRAQLELMRPHADEIVLAVNREGGLDTLDACADLADRRLTYDFEDSPSRLIAWVLHQCSADWILRLDDDEVPSAALLHALPELIRDRRPSAAVHQAPLAVSRAGDDDRPTRPVERRVPIPRPAQPPRRVALRRPCALRRAGAGRPPSRRGADLPLRPAPGVAGGARGARSRLRAHAARPLLWRSADQRHVPA